MATTTPRKPEPHSIPSVTEAQAAATAAGAEEARLQALIRGTVERWEPRSERLRFVTATGAVDEREINAPVLQTRDVPLGERLATKQALPQAEHHLLACEAALEEARQYAVVAARTQRAEAIRAGEQAVRAALPGLIADVRTMMDRFEAFHEEIARLDAAIGSAYFQPMAACPPFAPGGILDAWCRFVSDAFPADRR